MVEQALADARQAQTEISQGRVRGPLHGVPLAVKDLCWTKGVVTAAGMTLYKDFVPTEDGIAVRKLREAGAVILGKLKLTESAYADHYPSIPAPLGLSASHRMASTAPSALTPTRNLNRSNSWTG